MPTKIVDLIKMEKSQDIRKVEDEKKSVLLVFTMGSEKYALPAESVKEILRDAEIFPLPFAPNYMNGVVNRYGDPYAVIDPAILIDGKPQNSLLFIVLNDDSRTCFRISDVKDFYTVGEKDFVPFAQNDLSNFFEGSVKIQGEDVFLLKTEYFLEHLKHDIES